MLCECFQLIRRLRLCLCLIVSILILIWFLIHPSKKRTPRRITPTPVKEDQSKRRSSTSPFSSGSFVTSPLASESQGSPSSFQEERNMLKIIKSKRRSKGDSPWGIRTSSSPVSVIKTPPPPVFGDFLVTSSPKSSHAKSLEDLERQIHRGATKSDTSLACNDDVTSSNAEMQEVDVKKTDVSLVVVSKEHVTHKEKLLVLAKVYSNCITGLSWFGSPSLVYRQWYKKPKLKRIVRNKIKMISLSQCPGWVTFSSGQQKILHLLSTLTMNK